MYDTYFIFKRESMWVFDTGVQLQPDTWQNMMQLAAIRYTLHPENPGHCTNLCNFQPNAFNSVHSTFIRSFA